MELFNHQDELQNFVENHHNDLNGGQGLPHQILTEQVTQRMGSLQPDFNHQNLHEPMYIEQQSYNANFMGESEHAHELGEQVQYG